MKVLLVGGGGREHALAWKLNQDDPSVALFAAPGNPGMSELARCVPIPTSDLGGLLALAAAEAIDLTIVGPEAPLAAGLVDQFRAARLPVFGPTRRAAQIETSKAFSKRLLLAAGVPTARADVCDSAGEARAAVRKFGVPVVIKASGMAAGKGVIVCETLPDADAAIARMLDERAFGAAGDTVLVEEFMRGEELSVFGITDGTNVVPLVPAQDHKRLLPGDAGPNTGGMGAYAPAHVDPGVEMGASVVADVVEGIMQPTLAALRSAGTPFTGLLYAGLMLTEAGPRVVEFNCRFGDPETQAVLPVLYGSASLLELMVTVARGERLPAASMLARGHAVTTVLAAAGYPDAVRSGDRVRLPEPVADVLVFHAGTSRAPDGALVTAGGRVLGITGLGASLDDAHRRSVEGAEAVSFAGKQFRPDIGWRGLGRRAGAA